jgi:hypothetical protein
LRFYFILQARCFLRSLKNYNESPYTLLIVLSLAFIFISQVFLNKVQYAASLYLLPETAIILSLGGKTRNQFLSSIFLNKKYAILRILENLLAAFPFMIFLLLNNHFWLVIISIALSILLSFFNKIGIGYNFIIPSPFSKRPYEFTTGFRKTYLILFIIYCTNIYSIIINNLILGLSSLLAIFIICMTFYSHLDPVFYVWIHAQSAKTFLTKKIKTAVIYSLLLCLPPALFLIAIYPASIGLITTTLIVGLSYMVLTILYVYVNFPVKTTQSQNLQYMTGVLLPPLLILILPNFYFQSVRRLKEYLRC